MNRKRGVWEIVEAAKPGDHLSRAFDIFILSLIVLNVLAVMAETVQSIGGRFPAFFRWFEVISVIVFTVEYLIRLWSCTASERFRNPILGRMRFAITAMALIDLAAVLPFYLPMIAADLRFLRAVRLLRLFRVAKIGWYSKALRLIGRVLRNKKEELWVTASVACLLLILGSALLYQVEHDAQPEAFPSIPAAVYWAVATLTTVGYGDVCPITDAGRVIASLTAFLGIGMFALPTAILGAGFLEEVRTKNAAMRKCPHCGRNVTG